LASSLWVVALLLTKEINMADPLASVTVEPTSGDADASTPKVSVVATDESTGTPAITDREWSVNTVALVAGAAADVPTEVTLDFIAEGTYAVGVEVTNADGADSDSVTVTVTDAYVPPAYLSGQQWLGTAVERINPIDLPFEYRDGTACTPGLPDSRGIYLARQYGTVGLAGDVVFNGELLDISAGS
jgi:hypothetical protein